VVRVTYVQRRSAAPDAQAGHLMQVTDEVGRQLAELQLTLGEGPLLDASASGGPVLSAGLADAQAAARWPAFTPAACRAGAAARLRAYAYVSDLPLADVARDIVARRLRMVPDPDLFSAGET
jgi:hypothetical protein